MFKNRFYALLFILPCFTLLSANPNPPWVTVEGRMKGDPSGGYFLAVETEAQVKISRYQLRVYFYGPLRAEVSEHFRPLQIREVPNEMGLKMERALVREFRDLGKGEGHRFVFPIHMAEVGHAMVRLAAVPEVSESKFPHVGEAIGFLYHDGKKFFFSERGFIELQLERTVQDMKAAGASTENIDRKLRELRRGGATSSTKITPPSP